MIPGPPGAATIRAQARIDVWSGLEGCRVHPHSFGSTEYDARDNVTARFSTLLVGGVVVPVAYIGQDRPAAASETMFHTVATPHGPTRPRRVFLHKFRTWQWSTITTNNDIRLVGLDEAGLAALGTTRAELIESDAPHYSDTVLWAAAIAAALPEVDGMWWHSRQAPAKWCVVLFGQVPQRTGGVRRCNLSAVGPALPFALPEGLDLLDTIADGFDIEVVRP